MKRRRNPEIIAGRVAADGSIAAGDGFTMTRTATGTYAIGLPGNFRLVSIVATLISPAGLIVAAPTGFGTYNVSAVAQDASFYFVAVGVQQ